MIRVLIAPLDWGLGHATRCIPIILEFQRQGCEVVLAGSGDALTLLRREFPALRSFPLPAYRPRYPLHGSMAWTMARQLPHFVKVIADEHRVIQHIIEKEKIDLVISDNRYGCWSPKVPSIFITHQSNILMPKRFGWLQRPVRWLSEKMINRFDTCWIPDFPEAGLAGDLVPNERSRVRAKIQFIGWLSRFEHGPEVVKRLDVIAIFSGPEPQRSLMERAVVPQLENTALSYRVVRGLPSAHTAPSDGRIVNFLTSADLQACIKGADLIIARSGYSTIMDMQALAKKVVFIPTPGQTEQEYLANRLKVAGIAFFMKQDEFDLQRALQETKNYTGFQAVDTRNALRQTVASVLRARS